MKKMINEYIEVVENKLNSKKQEKEFLEFLKAFPKYAQLKS